MSNSRKNGVDNCLDSCMEPAELGIECITDSATKWNKKASVAENATTVPFRLMACGIGLTILGIFGCCGGTAKLIKVAKNSDCTRSAPAEQSMDEPETPRSDNGFVQMARQ